MFIDCIIIKVPHEKSKYMKNKSLLIVSILLIGLAALFAFTSKEAYTPIVVDRTTFESSICSMPPQKLVNPGKVFTKGHQLFVIEQFYGVHLFNNIDPKNPQKVGFIRILGCTDVAVKGTIMYASSGEDLVTIDISNISEVKELDREVEVLSELTNPDGEVPFDYSKGQRPENTVIIAWKKQ